jgi:hypothetical protein
MVEEKHAFVARTTLTCTAPGELVSAAKSVAGGLARIMTARVAPAAAMNARLEGLMDDT